MGAPLIELDEQQLERLAACGLSVAKIAEIVGVSRSTLYERFRTVLDKGREEIHHQLRAAQIRVALQGNVTMLIWLGKQLLGQKDKSETEVTGEIQTTVKVIIDGNWFGSHHPGTRSLAAPGGDPALPGPAQGDPVRPALGQDGVGSDSDAAGPRPEQG